MADAKTERAMAALDTMAEVWAAKFQAAGTNLRGAVRAMLACPDAEDRILNLIKQAHAEGLFDGFHAGKGFRPQGVVVNESSNVEAGNAEYDSWPRWPLRTQYVRFLEKALEGWKEECQRRRDAADALLEELQTRTLHQDRDVWYWQGDGTDHPESMSNSMVVVIRAAALRRILRGADSAKDERRG